MKVQTFTRSWYRYEKMNGKRELVPHMGRKSNIEYVNSIEEAKEKCKKYNDNNDPGPTSRKMEFTTDY